MPCRRPGCAQAVESSGIENLGGWLTTVVGRVSLDMLRSRTSRRGALRRAPGRVCQSR